MVSWFILLCKKVEQESPTTTGINSKTLNKQFYMHLTKLIAAWNICESTDRVILGGYFNLTPNEYEDHLLSRGCQHTFNETLLHLTSNVGLSDCWCLRNPGARQYTWSNDANKSQCSRLNFFVDPS